MIIFDIQDSQKAFGSIDCSLRCKMYFWFMPGFSYGFGVDRRREKQRLIRMSAANLCRYCCGDGTFSLGRKV